MAPLDRDSAFDAASGLYWYASDWHGGQDSKLYSIMSTMGYQPGCLERGPDDVAQEYYDALASGAVDASDLYEQIKAVL